MRTVYNPWSRKLDYVGGGSTINIDAPVSPTTGDFWYESDTGILWIWDGASWVQVGSSGPSDGYLTESGDFLLTESGDYLVME